MNIEQARTNMIKQQIRTCGVADEHTLDLLQHTPREEFVPSPYRDFACADFAIPLPHEQVMMTPKDEAYMLQSLDIHLTDQVLEIGTGSGYVTALLAKLARRIVSIDIFADFTLTTSQKLKNSGIHHVELLTGDAALGWPAQAPYDVIVATGSFPVLPVALKKMLTLGGRLFAIVGQAPAMEATLITRVADDRWRERKLFETVVPALIHAPTPPVFVF